jgi:hypothetical protein
MAENAVRACVIGLNPQTSHAASKITTISTPRRKGNQPYHTSPPCSIQSVGSGCGGGKSAKRRGRHLEKGHVGGWVQHRRFSDRRGNTSPSSQAEDQRTNTDIGAGAPTSSCAGRRRTLAAVPRGVIAVGLGHQVPRRSRMARIDCRFGCPKADDPERQHRVGPRHRQGPRSAISRRWLRVPESCRSKSPNHLVGAGPGSIPVDRFLSAFAALRLTTRLELPRCVQ